MEIRSRSDKREVRIREVVRDLQLGPYQTSMMEGFANMTPREKCPDTLSGKSD